MMYTPGAAGRRSSISAIDCLAGATAASRMVDGGRGSPASSFSDMTLRYSPPMSRRLFILLSLCLTVALGGGARAAGSPVVGKLRWLGQSCFVLETAAGTRIVMDPIPKGL